MVDRHESKPSRVALREISPHPVNFRKRLTDLDELAASIARQGLVEPLEVMPADRVAAAWPDHASAFAGHAWVLLSGHRRFAAARRAYNDDPDARIPVSIRQGEVCDNAGLQLDAMITEEVAHRAWNPIEQARAFHAARAAGRTQAEIAELYACAQSQVSQRLALLKLPDELAQVVETGDLAVRDGLKLARLDDHDRMRAVWRIYLNQREDAWIRTIDQAIAEHADRASYQATRQAALDLAVAEGLPVVDPIEEFGRDLSAHRLAEPEQIATARAAGTLVAGISGHGDLEYYTTRRMGTPDSGPPGPDSDQRRAAAAARERAGRLLAATRPPVMPPAAASMFDAFLRSAPDGWRPIARRWLRWLQLGPAQDIDAARWWEQVYAADWDTRVWAAHCLALAESEHRARTHQEWDDTDQAWVWRLITEAGYLPRSWERDRLTAGDDQADGQA